MKEMVTRRDFMQAALLGGGAGIFVLPTLSADGETDNSAEGVCVTLASHWSYIGIGWQLGLESCVLSVVDAMEMADRPPYVKTLINQDAHSYELMAEKYPEVVEKLKQYLAAGKVELIAGTYSQPLGTMYSGESNIRQIVYGRELIRKALDYEMVTFLEEESFTHPQLPQILTGAGYQYASLAQVDTWLVAGVPKLELNVFHWKGKDGTTIPSVPRNSLYGYSPDLKQLASAPSFHELQKLGKPLIITWEEFGWEPPEQPAYLRSPDKYKKFAEEYPVEFVTLKEYMKKYGANARETIYLNMDSWNELLTWGVGGDQLRIFDRKVEALLLAAERFDAISAAFGAEAHPAQLQKAWQDLLTSQSHDVCGPEYTRWAGDRMAPLDRLEDHHNFTWGGIGFQHLDLAQNSGTALLDAAVGHLIKEIGSDNGKWGQHVATVFNPSGWERTAVTATGKIYPIPEKTKSIVVKDGSGRVVPSQVIKSDTDKTGNLVVADVAFLAEKVPSVGYDTYYLEFAPSVVPAVLTDLKIDELNLGLENRFLRIQLNPKTGAIASLFDKVTGREMLDGERGSFPVFTGKPNPNFPLRSVFVAYKYPKEDMAIPDLFDSSKSVARVVPDEKAGPSSDVVDWRAISASEIRWTEKGPLRATVRAQHNWPLLKFETYVTLYAGLPWVEVTSRVLAEIPPAPDAMESTMRFPTEIKNGYWLSFAPGFQPISLVRDFPFGVEPAERHYFHALTFVDLVGKDAGLLVLHPGTQYFKRDSNGVISNLLMREWESFWVGEYGWPRYSEYRHILMPHGTDFTNSDRLRASAETTQKLMTVVGKPQSGTLPKRKGFVNVGPEGVLLSAFRKKNDLQYELRVVETEGREAESSVEMAIPISGVAETNLLGNKVAAVSRRGSTLNFKILPWKIRTFELT